MSQTEGRARSVLIVDDEISNVTLLVAMLAKIGYSSVEALTSPVQALEVLRTSPPHILLLDLQMPDLSGFEVMEQMAAMDVHPLVLVLTADDTEAAAERARSLGALAILLKPFSRVELEQALDSLGTVPPESA